jgi:hypothetical protein
MKNYFIYPESYLLILFLFLYFNCSKQEAPVPPEKLNVPILSELVMKAVNNDTTANMKLSNLIDYSFPVNNNFNNLTIDSLVLKDSSVIFFTLLEYPNPLYNRFAVYNSTLKPLMIDKSLNGNIFIDKVETGSKQFIKIDEVFLSKDTLTVNRLSLYEIDTTGVSLSLRTHTKLIKPDREFTQDITGFTDSLIITLISSSRRSPVDKLTDSFKYNPSLKKYLSTGNLFDEFVKEEIENFLYEARHEELY